MTEPRNPLRSRAASLAAPAAGTLAAGLAGLAAAAVFAGAGRPRPAGAALAASAVALLAACSSPPPRGAFAGYVRGIADGIADAAVLIALAWPLRNAPPRLMAAVVAAAGLVMVGAYAQVRAASLGYRAPAVAAGAPERSLVLAAGLLIPDALEWSLWAVAAAGGVAVGRTTASVWRHR